MDPDWRYELADEDEGLDRVAMYEHTRGLAGERFIEPDVYELISKLGEKLVDIALQSVRLRGAFHLALSGGSTPQRLYHRMVTDVEFRLLPWSKMHLWLVDDRSVPLDDDASNSGMLQGFFADHVPIDPGRLHLMQATAPDGDLQYEQALARHLGAAGRLDYVLLGMGEDGHTASLFPGSPALTVTDRQVVFNDGETVTRPRPRLTMTYELINAARHIAVLVTGRNKHAMLKRVAVSGLDVKHLPITGIRPDHRDHRMFWYLDADAAAGYGD